MKAKRLALEGEIAHFLKSPLASMQALTMILQRQLQKKQAASLPAVTEINAKITLLHTRLELFLEYLQYKEGTRLLTYAFFKLRTLLEDLAKELTQNKIVYTNQIPDQEMLGDKNRLISSLVELMRQTFVSTEVITLSFSKKRGAVQIAISQAISKKRSSALAKNDPEDSLKLYIAENCITFHGGEVVQKQSRENLTLTIDLPLKAKAPTQLR